MVHFDIFGANVFHTVDSTLLFGEAHRSSTAQTKPCAAVNGATFKTINVFTIHLNVGRIFPQYLPLRNGPYSVLDTGRRAELVQMNNVLNIDLDNDIILFINHISSINISTAVVGSVTST